MLLHVSAIPLSIMSLEGHVIVGQAVEFRARTISGMTASLHWKFGDGASGEGVVVSHVYENPGIYHVELRAKDGSSERTSSVILRVHTPQTVHLPQILLDTDARNEVDDQHYISYALFSELDFWASTAFIIVAVKRPSIMERFSG